MGGSSIPFRVPRTGRGAFDRCPSLTVIVNRDTYAVEYCRSNNVSYQYPDSMDWLKDE